MLNGKSFHEGNFFVDVCRSERNEFGSENSDKNAPSLFLSEYLGREELSKRDKLRFSRGF